MRDGNSPLFLLSKNATQLFFLGEFSVCDTAFLLLLLGRREA
jgi:hypothetical protein